MRSLLEALGAASEEHNGELKVTFRGEIEVLQPARGKDIDAEMIVDPRRMLTREGIARPRWTRLISADGREGQLAEFVLSGVEQI